MDTPIQVLNALRHVARHHPEVTQVTYDKAGSWLFTDGHGHAPAFCKDIDVDILNEAYDEAEWGATYTLTNQGGSDGKADKS